jgi:outer membrane receptor protein involved in Fe transport
MRRPPAPLAALIFATAAQAAIAASPPSPAPPGGAEGAKHGDPVHKLEDIDVVAKKRADDRRESTTTRIVVQHDEIVRYGDTTLADVLQRLPGVTVGDAQQRGSGIAMRGLANGYTRILLDGEPVPAGFDIDSLSPELVERIEILRAPSADLGTQAIAGTINIVLRKAVGKPHRGVKLRASNERGEPGYGATTDISARDGPRSYLVVASVAGESRDRPSVAEQRGVDALGNTNLRWLTRQLTTTDIRGASVAPRITWEAGERDTLTSENFVRYRLAKGRNAEDTATLEGAPPTFSADDLDFRYERTALSSRVGWVHRTDEGATLDMKLGVTYSDWTGDVTFRGFDANGDLDLDRSVKSESIEHGATSAGKYLTPFGDGHALALGWDGQYVHRDERRRQIDTTAAGALLADIDESYRARVSQLALYAQDEWDITPRWSAYAGVRWVSHDTRTAASGIDEVGNESRLLSPIFQTLWRSAEAKGDQVRFSVSRTFRAPRTGELTPRRYLANNNTQTTPDYQGNPDLRPEVAWGFDTAYEHYVGESGIVSVSAYARRIDDVIVERLANVDGTWITSPSNDGDARVYGIEAEAKVDLRSLRKAAPNVRIHANFARNWSSVDQVPGPDNRLERQRPLTANVGFDYALDGYPWTLGANFSFRRGGNVRLSVTQSDTLPVRRVLDVYALWKLDPNTRIRLSLANVLGQDRVSATSYFDDSGTLTLTTTAPTRTVVRMAVEFSL